jgi:hypothetical protein
MPRCKRVPAEASQTRPPRPLREVVAVSGRESLSAVPLCRSCVADESGRWEPKRLLLRLFSVGGHPARSGHRPRLRLVERWPWADQITVAITRLQALLAD